MFDIYIQLSSSVHPPLKSTVCPSMLRTQCPLQKTTGSTSLNNADHRIIAVFAWEKKSLF